MSEEINEGGYGSPQPEDEVPTNQEAAGDKPSGQDGEGDEGEQPDPPASNGPVRERPEDDYR